MKFYIVTPTYNSLSWLPLCIRSVSDQAGNGVEVHHHVQDGGSADGTAEYLKDWQDAHEGSNGYTFTYESCKDAGMYDALNKAWQKMPADTDVTAHLNSDEQYLPNALKVITDAFQEYPRTDIVLSAYIIVDAEGNYICHRRPVKPWRWSSQTACEMMTCTCFHRAEAFLKHGIRFDTSFRSIADMIMYRNIVNYGVQVRTAPHSITSVFTVTGQNLGWSELTHREWAMVFASMPRGAELLSKFTNKLNSARRRFTDLFCKSPKGYELYSSGSVKRIEHTIHRPTSHWGCRTVADK